MSEDVKKELEQLFMRHIDIKKLLKRAFFGGFDSYKDYEKYGDAFVPIYLQNGNALDNADDFPQNIINLKMMKEGDSVKNITMKDG